MKFRSFHMRAVWGAAPADGYGALESFLPSFFRASPSYGCTFLLATLVGAVRVKMDQNVKKTKTMVLSLVRRVPSDGQEKHVIPRKHYQAPGVARVIQIHVRIKGNVV
jgi:hypothetical protein